MDKVNEYRHRAEECRKLATSTPLELRVHYQELAAMWDRLADERVTFFVVPDASSSGGSEN
jgi:hypothetical protein